jgi:oligopeptide/dipeptide ABC transporter ATP-binding protein
MSQLPIIQARGLTVEYPLRKPFFSSGLPPTVKAVSGVDVSIAAGETLAVVGESGCGKSTLGRALLRSAPVTSGQLLFKGQDITALRGEALRKARKDFQMIFQDPFASLNPKMRISEILAEPLQVHTQDSRAEVRHKVVQMLEAAGLSADVASRYPHEFSGGQRQRVAIARATILRPALIVADEPLSALDVSLQLQIIELFRDLKQRFALTYLFISHDLARVFGFADRIAVMYLGKIVEIGSARELYENPRHPYTHALIAAVPSPQTRLIDTAPPLRGEIPNPANPPAGCRFNPRCPRVMEVCRREAPRVTRFSAQHHVACHLYTPGDPASNSGDRASR